MAISSTSGINQAINAYQSAARAADAEQSQDVGKAGKNGEFFDLVTSALEEARRIGERSEQLSIAGVNDRADITEVVTAVAEAEATLQTVVTVRDRVIEAYREILRMPI